MNAHRGLRVDGEFSRRDFLKFGAAGAGLLMLSGCGGGNTSSSASKTLDLAYIEWDENVANSHVIKQIAEKDLGYESVNLKLGDVGPVFEGVAGGDSQAFLDAWLPGHKEYLDKVGDGARLIEEPWYLGETEYGIAVPDYMSDIQSVEDLNESGAEKIIGIEPGALLMQRIEENVIPEYDLNVELVGSSTPAMLAALEKAYREKEPFVFLGWSPHWMNARYDFHYLDDPKNAMGEIDDPATLHAVVHKDLESNDPVAFALINAMKFTKEQVDTLELEINEAAGPAEGASKWLEKNRDVVKPWIEAAQNA